MTFSIIIPVYNIASYLRECLDSVFVAVQELENRVGVGEKMAPPFIEVICVDDGSTDESGAILDEYREKVEKRGGGGCRFVVIHQANAGVSAARNAALDVAKGEYLVFVDGDDGLVPNALEVLARQIEATRADIIRFGCVSVESLTEPVSEAVESNLRQYDLEHRDEARMAYRLIVGSLIAWNGCYRRECVKNVRFLPIPNGEDIVFGAECFCRARRIAVSDARLYRYVRRAGSAVRSVNLRHVKSALTAIEETARLTSEWKFGKEVADLLVRKNRAGMMGVVAPKLPRVQSADRREAEAAFYKCLDRLAWNTPCRIVARTQSRLLRRLLLEWPFLLRVRLLAMMRRLRKA